MKLLVRQLGKEQPSRAASSEAVRLRSSRMLPLGNEQISLSIRKGKD